MLRTTLFSLLVFTILAGVSDGYAGGKDSDKRPILVTLLKNLFSHSKHKSSFDKLGVSCQDCHLFSVKPTEKSPHGPNVTKNYVAPWKDTCHRCHLENISVPIPNQCELCHSDARKLAPRDHLLDWRQRHGRPAGFNEDSCRKCHKRNECSDCHLRHDNLKRRVHRGNFRLTHSLEARRRPQSCIVCHQSKQFCSDCHSRRRK